MGRPVILAVASSPRRGGNSETMLDAAIAGAAGAGAAVEKVALRDLGFKPCLNCGGCSKTGRCVLKDEYSALNERIRAADGMILASPIYFASLCAQMKCLVDRGQPFWVEKYKLKRKVHDVADRGRSALFLCCGGFAKGDRFLANAEQIVKVYLLCLGFDWAGSVFEAGIDGMGAIGGRPEALERCGRAGAELAGRAEAAGRPEVN